MKSLNAFLLSTLMAMVFCVACKSIRLGEKKAIDEGGFSFNIVPGYTYEAQGPQVIMTAPNASSDTGPLFMLSSINLPEGTTLDTMISGIIGSPINAEITNVKVNGLSCRTIESSDSSTGSLTSVKFLFCLPSSTRGFLLAGAAPTDQWDKGVKQYFDPIVNSLNFYDPIIAPTQLP